MKTNLIMALFFLFISQTGVLSQPGISWQKTLGGSDHEYTCKTIPTSDGGMAFVGFSESSNGDVSGNHGGVDLWVGKLNSAGSLQWSFLYGGTEDDQGYDLLQTADGGYMVAGWTESSDGNVTGHHGTYNSDFWVLKLNPDGTLAWNKCYGGDDDDEAKAIVKTSGNRYYVAGTTYSSDGDVSGNHGSSTDAWVIKINASGTLLGQRCVGGTSTEEGINMILTADNGCVICGRSYSSDGDVTGYHSGSDMLVAKLDSSLNVSWAKCFGGTQTEEANSAIQLSDGSYAVLGYTSTHNNGDVTGHHGAQGMDDFWLVKLTSAGSLSWAKCFGGSGDDQANGLDKTSDGGFILCGLTNSTDGDVTGFHTAMFDPDVWVAKVSGTGSLLWQRCCGGSGQDEGFSVFESGSDVFTVTAFTYSNDYDVSGNHGNADGWICKVTGSSSVSEWVNENGVRIYPNPVAERFFVEAPVNSGIKLINEIGITVFHFQSLEAVTSVAVNELPSGIYLIHVIYKDLNITRKIIIK